MLTDGRVGRKTRVTNLVVLIHEMYELGIDPAFWAAVGMFDVERFENYEWRTRATAPTTRYTISLMAAAGLKMLVPAKLARNKVEQAAPF
jgi:hypothetical protein